MNKYTKKVIHKYPRKAEDMGGRGCAEIKDGISRGR
jgi:hypothetical protein